MKYHKVALLQETHKTSRIHLPFLDGLRGLAAFYVVLFHEVVINTELPGQLAPPLALLARVLNHGHASVVVFVVLSGFSLTIPVARLDHDPERRRRLSGGLRNFFQKRARRILPAYYAALAFSLISIAAYERIGPLVGLVPRHSPGVFGTASIGTHILLVHNLFLDFVYKTNIPMWSVATEVQIYVVFAIVLLPVCRRLGVLPAVLLAWILGTLPAILLPTGRDFWWAAPWLLGTFAMGMGGAFLCFGQMMPGSQTLRDHLRHAHGQPPRAGQVEPGQTRRAWGLLLALATLFAYHGWGTDLPVPAADAITSLLAIEAIVIATSTVQTKASHGLVVRILSSRSATFLGGCSYSLYLTHFPLLRLFAALAGKLGMSRDTSLVLQITVLTPILVLVAWGFSRIFEKPFLRA